MNKEKEKKKSDQDDDKLLGKLRDKFDICKQHYGPIHKRMRLLDATDRGDLWKALKAKFPPYQILPDTNFVTFVKSNLVSSIYTVTKSAEVQPTSEQDKDITMYLNIALEQVWSLSNVGYYQFKAGERAALLNIGITQVGWSEDLTAGSGDSFYKGNVTLKNINPLKFMRDPFAVDLQSSGWCLTYDKYHKSVFKSNKLYSEAYKKYREQQKFAEAMEIPDNDGRPTPDKDYYTLVIFWVKTDKGIDEIHTINCEYILHKKENIVPNEYPFAILYCNEPAENLVGVSECSKVFANNVAYNLMDSIALTSEYKNQRPPKFVSASAGLNINSFAKHGDEADRTFIVNGRAQDAVYYHQFPQISSHLPQLKAGLEQGIQTMTGIDGRYTGRDTGSVITTGGVEEMLNRVTVIDTPKIMHYENYTKQLTKLVLANLVQFAPKRKYFFKKPNSTKWDSIEVDFPKIDEETLFNYKINVSSELPNNKQRVAEMANMLMEKQMQYQEQGASVQLITEEEWLMFQDLPNKEYLLERMGVQRQQNAVEEVSQTLFNYAELVKQGMNPSDAILATANSLQSTRMGQGPDVGAIPGAMPDGQVMGMDMAGMAMDGMAMPNM